MRISGLWDKHCGETAYIVGTGASMRMFPADLLADCLVIGLNQAWRHVDVTYLLTIHAHEPDVVPNRQCFPPGTLITKAKGNGWASKLTEDDQDIFVFRNNTDIHDFTYLREKVEGRLYCGRGIQATALSLAAHMGCRYAVLVGCDMCSLGGDHHGHDQHVRFHGLSPDDVYGEYYECTAAVRDICYEEFGMETLTLSPFVGLKNADIDYLRLRNQRGMESLPQPKDTSSYDRQRDWFREAT